LISLRRLVPQLFPKAEQLENIRTSQEKLQRECIEAMLKAADADERIVLLNKRWGFLYQPPLTTDLILVIRISELIANDEEKDIKINELMTLRDE
jgi:hypothetical protein